jgi:hypothetical protein
MRIILSRKGFDSGYGGCPSPILPDGTLLSLPIPSRNDKTKFSDLFYEEKSLYQVIKDLKPGTKIKENYTCHLDPDIRDFKTTSNWVSLFGQEGASQTHLMNNNISQDDIFLFFGWFRQTKIEDGILKYVAGSPDLHIIFGYFQIGKLFDSFVKLPSKLSYHPHATRMRYEKKNNCIYQANEKLSMNSEIKGSGTFSITNDLILTKKGYSRSKWDLPDFFKNVKISYHTEKSFKTDYFDSAKIGQEFVIEENEGIENWALNIIKKGLSTIS